MKKIAFENLPSTNTPINSTNLNQVQDNVEKVFNGGEAMGSIVVEDIKCKNIYDSYSYPLMVNNAINGDTGDIYSSTTNWYATKEYIPVNKYVRKNIISSSDSTTICFYDSSKAFISKISKQGIIPTNAYYMRFDTHKDYVNELYIELGTTLTGYTSYKDFGYNSTDSMGEIVVDDITCKNLFAPLKSMTASGITITQNPDDTYNISGTNTSSNAIECTVLVDLDTSHIKNGETYTLSSNKQLPNGLSSRVEMFNEGNWVRGFVPSINSTTPTNSGVANTTNINKIRFGIFISSGATINIQNVGFQLEKGSVATKYVEHKDFTNNSPSIITANLAEETSLSTTSAIKVPLSATVNIGNKLSVNDGGIVIGAGVNHIKVSATARFDSTAEGNILTLYIKNNGTNYMYANAIAKGNRESLSLTPRIITVTKGDVITLEAQNGSSTGSRLAFANKLATYVTVEVIY